MHPKLTILTDPTPLTRLHRLSDQLGVDLFIKRDDLAGPSFGGNKARQLEYYFGDALAKEADTILITGAVQSNFARLAAAIARMQGMHAVVQLEERVATTSQRYRTSGNVLLSQLLGAEVTYFPVGEDEAGADAALHQKADELRGQGRRPYIIHLSEGHPPLGALGYIDAAREILGQSGNFDVYVVGSGSGSTHAGLLAGLRAAGSAATVIGSCVRRDANAQAARLRRIIDRLVKIYPDAAGVSDEDIVVWDGALAPGYGQLGPLSTSAIKLMAQSEGMILDPVYTAKSFAAIPALIDTGDIPKGSRICFVHTGGLGGFFAYDEVLATVL